MTGSIARQQRTKEYLISSNGVVSMLGNGRSFGELGRGRGVCIADPFFDTKVK
jgi:hypothetical protein